MNLVILDCEASRGVIFSIRTSPLGWHINALLSISSTTCEPKMRGPVYSLFALFTIYTTLSEDSKGVSFMWRNGCDPAAYNLWL
jgi:hypothetical protein